MVALGLKDDTKPSTNVVNEKGAEGVSLKTLSELTGFPIDYIKRELMLSDDQELSMEDLRSKVLSYLDSAF
jgi:hypothetical protein